MVNEASVTSVDALDMRNPQEGCGVAGRRPEGFRPPPRATADALAAETAERTRLAAALAVEPDPDVASRCGLPSAHVAAVLHDRLAAGLWAA